MKTPNSLPPVPSYDEQLQLLVNTGDQFSDEDRAASQRILPNVYTTVDGHYGPAQYDARIVPRIPSMIAPSRVVFEALTKVRDPGTYTTTDPEEFIEDYLAHPGLNIGFSGYGTGGGYGYHVEAEAITDILDTCELTDKPARAISDGGTGYGVPGVSGMVAQGKGRHTYSVGTIPLRGLRGAVYRDTTLVTGEQFGDEADALGALPDLLVVMGGEVNAEKELHAALSLGTTVLFAIHKAYRPQSTVYALERHATAFPDNQPIVTTNRSETLQAIADMNLEQLQDNRRTRGDRLYQLLRHTT